MQPHIVEDEKNYYLGYTSKFLSNSLHFCYLCSMILYHGTTSKFDHFDLTHLGEGEGKSKFGVGHYASTVYATAALYAGKCKGETKYV